MDGARLWESAARYRRSQAAATRCWLIDGVQTSEVPGWSASELYVGDRLLQADNTRVLPLFAQLCETMRSA